MQTAFTPLGTFEAHSKTPPLTDVNGASMSPTPAVIPLPMDGNQGESAEETAARLKKLIDAQMASGRIPPGSVTVKVTPDGVVVSLHEIGFFASGSAEVRGDALPVVVTLAAAIPRGRLRVEGHTDNVPIHTAQFATNWELSTARASAIARLLLENGDLNPAELAAAGYAEYHPVATNATEDGRAENRRVDIILLRRQGPSR